MLTSLLITLFFTSFPLPPPSPSHTRSFPSVSVGAGSKAAAAPSSNAGRRLMSTDSEEQSQRKPHVECDHGNWLNGQWTLDVLTVGINGGECVVHSGMRCIENSRDWI
jgi:hypothetical protein